MPKDTKARDTQAKDPDATGLTGQADLTTRIPENTDALTFQGAAARAKAQYGDGDPTAISRADTTGLDRTQPQVPAPVRPEDGGPGEPQEPAQADATGGQEPPAPQA